MGHGLCCRRREAAPGPAARLTYQEECEAEQREHEAWERRHAPEELRPWEAYSEEAWERRHAPEEQREHEAWERRHAPGNMACAPAEELRRRGSNLYTS